MTLGVRASRYEKLDAAQVRRMEFQCERQEMSIGLQLFNKIRNRRVA